MADFGGLRRGRPIQYGFGENQPNNRWPATFIRSTTVVRYLLACGTGLIEKIFFLEIFHNGKEIKLTIQEIKQQRNFKNKAAFT